jgi:hypothetical protein
MTASTRLRPPPSSFALGRHAAYLQAFGLSEPPGANEGTTIPFPDSLADAIPGGVVHAYPPDPERARATWLFVTAGASNPPPGADGRWLGTEFAVETPEFADWAPGLLFQLAGYGNIFRERDLGAGDRFPVCFGQPGRPRAPEAEPFLFELLPSGVGRVTGTAAVVLWPLAQLPERTLGGGDRLVVLQATTITAGELALAEATSTAHLLHLLGRLGLGRASDPLRPCATKHARFAAEWERTARLPFAEVSALAT